MYGWRCFVNVGIIVCGRLGLDVLLLLLVVGDWGGEEVYFVDELLFVFKFRIFFWEVLVVKCFLIYERFCYEERREEYDMVCFNDNLK